jgi:hypothetical protein
MERWSNRALCAIEYRTRPFFFFLKHRGGGCLKLF